MKTISMLVLVASLAAGGSFVAVPAMAAASVAGSCNGGQMNEDVAKNPDMYQDLLKSEGFDVSGVQEWGGCIRAFMTDASGHQSMVFFDPLTLKELGVDAATTTKG